MPIVSTVFVNHLRWPSPFYPYFGFNSQNKVTVGQIRASWIIRELSEP